MRPLVRRVDQPGGHLRLHRLHREEPVGDGAERVAQPVRVGEAGAAGAARAARPPRSRRPSSRCRARAACPSTSACRPTARSTRPRRRTRRHRRRAVPRERAARRRRASSPAGSGSRRSRRRARERRSAARDAAIIVGDSVSESSGSISSRASGSTSPSRVQHLPGRRPLAEDGVEKRLHLGADLGLRPVRRQRLDQRRRLDQRVVGDARHRRVAAAAVDAQAERRGHLLGARAECRTRARRARPARRRLR